MSLFAMHQATSDIEGQIEFYKQWGFGIDRGYEALEGEHLATGICCWTNMV